MYGTRSDAANLAGFLAAVVVIVLSAMGYNKFMVQQETYTAVITVCGTEDSYTKDGHEYRVILPDGHMVVMDVEETPWGAVRRDRLDTKVDFDRLAQDVDTYGPSTYNVTLKGKPWMVFDTKPNLITYKLAAVQSPKLCDAKKAIPA